jgi:hypothetical protein
MLYTSFLLEESGEGKGPLVTLDVISFRILCVVPITSFRQLLVFWDIYRQFEGLSAQLSGNWPEQLS